MGEHMDKVPEAVQDHIRSITKTSGLPENEESMEQLASAWLEKKEIFEQRVSEKGMEEIEEFGAAEERGALLLTYSGSLLTVGPLVDGKRTVDYTSIGIRRDVPDHSSADATALKEDVAVDSVATFTNGPVKSSSAVYMIAVTIDELEPEVEEELLSDVTKVLADDFIEVNKTIVQS